MSPLKRTQELRKLVEKNQHVFDSKELKSKKMRQEYVGFIDNEIKKLRLESVSLIEAVNQKIYDLFINGITNSAYMN